MKHLNIVVVILLHMLCFWGCATEEVKIDTKVVELTEKEVSCSFNQLDGECRVFSSFLGDVKKGSEYSICNLGICSNGNCENGSGNLSYPGGSKLEGNFIQGKLNGEGNYDGCGSSYKGTFKDNMKEKGVLITNDKMFFHYYNGNFQNEMRNGKGIYFSSRDSYIYEGTWKNNIKNGKFIIYSNVNKDLPLIEKGSVMKRAYIDSKKISYVNDRDKEEIEQEERERKHKAIEEERERKNIAEFEKTKKKCLRECTHWENDIQGRSGRWYKDEGYNCSTSECEEFMNSTISR